MSKKMLLIWRQPREKNEGNPQSDKSSSTSAAPHPMSVIQEHSKTVITLATALLGLTITFADKLVGTSPSLLRVIWLSFVWLLLMISITAGIVAVVQMYRYLLGQTSGDGSLTEESLNYRRRAANASSISYIVLIIAGFVFGSLGFSQLYNSGKQLDASASANLAMQFLQSVYQRDNAKWKITAITLDDPTKTYQVVILEESSSQKYGVIIDSRSGRITKFELIP